MKSVRYVWPDSPGAAARMQAEWAAYRLPVARGGDVARLHHRLQDLRPSRLGVVGPAERVVGRRRLGQAGEQGRLVEREILRVHAEVRLGRGVDPVRLLPEVDVVQVRREDAVLAPLLVELNREARLGELSAERLLRREVEVAYELLLDRGRPLRDPARGDVALQRAHDPDVVDPVVLVEAPVLGVDDRLAHHGTDPLQRDGSSVAGRAEQPEPRAVARQEDARLGRALRLEAVRGCTSTRRRVRRRRSRPHTRRRTRRRRRLRSAAPVSSSALPCARCPLPCDVR